MIILLNGLTGSQKASARKAQPSKQVLRWTTAATPPGRCLASLRRTMPNKSTVRKARKSAREGKSESTQAGEFVHDEIRHVREGKHGAKNAKQAIAIGLSKARRAGVKLRPPSKKSSSPATRRKATRDAAAAKSSRGQRRPPSRKRSRATTEALGRKGRSAGSRRSLSQQSKRSAAGRRSRRSANRAGQHGAHSSQA